MVCVSVGRLVEITTVVVRPCSMGVLAEMISWIATECPSYYDVNGALRPSHVTYAFKFTDRIDAAKFKLTWGNYYEESRSEIRGADTET